MYKLYFSSQISSAKKIRIENIFEKYYSKIQKIVFLSDKPIDILVHISDNDRLDGYAEMSENYIILQISREFTDDDFIAIMTHELFHLAFYSFYGERKKIIDAVIDEGMALVAEDIAREVFGLHSSIRKNTWKRKMNYSEKLDVLKKIIKDEKYLYDNYNDLLLNTDLQNKKIADNTFYQIGYWISNEIMTNCNISFKDLFFKNKNYWINYINELMEGECR